jgi:uncharacterized membrane protein YidH (DUF202 family)
VIAFIILIPTIGKKSFQRYKQFFNKKEEASQVEEQEALYEFAKLKKVISGAVFLMTIAVCTAYGALACVSVTTVLGSGQAGWLTPLNAGLFGIALCAGITPFITIPAYNFLTKKFIYKDKKFRLKKHFWLALIGEASLFFILVYCLNKELKTIFPNSSNTQKTAIKISSYILVTLAIILVALATQNQYCQENKEKDQKESSSSNSLGVTILSVTAITIMGLVGGSAATYVGAAKIAPGIPVFGRVLWAVIPILYWGMLYWKGAKAAIKFCHEKKYKRLTNRKNMITATLTVLTAGITFVTGLGISCAVNAYYRQSNSFSILNIRVIWTITVISAIVSIAAGSYAHYKLTNKDIQNRKNNNDHSFQIELITTRESMKNVQEF